MIASFIKRTILGCFSRFLLTLCLILFPLSERAEEPFRYPVQPGVISQKLELPDFRLYETQTGKKTDKSVIAVRVLLPLVGGAIGAVYGGTHFKSSQPGSGVFYGFLGGMLVGLCFEVYTF